MAARYALVEPLPLVPPTMMSGKSGARPSASLTRRTRSRPRSIVLGCSRSSRASQASREVSRCTIRLRRDGMPDRNQTNRRDAGMSPPTLGGQSAWDSGCQRRPAHHHRQRGRELATHLAAIDDTVDGTLLLQEFGALEAFRQGFAHGLLDYARPGKAD